MAVMDIVERLNEMIGKGEYYEPEFEQAKAEIERLREALEKTIQMIERGEDAWYFARSVLQQKESE